MQLINSELPMVNTNHHSFQVKSLSEDGRVLQFIHGSVAQTLSPYPRNDAIQLDLNWYPNVLVI